jgi:hypothetical protein
VDFSIEQRIAAPIEAVETALFDGDFIAATKDLPNLGHSALLDETRDGSVVTVRIQRRFTGQLSSMVTRVVDPSKLTWVEHVTYDLDAHRGRHQIVPDNYADRLQSTYTTVLALDGGGTTARTARGSLDVRSPIARRRVEQAIVSGLDEYAQAEADLLGRWLSSHA